jgi:TetR/AcrR family transcriptional regulator, mexJK operon transcriptional repressor
MIAVTPRQEAKREQIRAAARRLFLEQGFAETSMDAVTAAAGVSKQTLYRYYESKSALFGDVLGQLIAEPPPMGGKRAKTESPRNLADLQRLLVVASRRYLARVMEPEQLALLRVVIAEGNRFPDLTESFRTTVPASGGVVIMSTLEGARSSGLLAEWVDLRTAARAFAGLLVLFILRDGLLVAEPKLPSEKQVAEVVQIFVAGVGSGRTAR